MIDAYAGLIILICGFVLGDISGFNRYYIKRNEQKKEAGTP